MPDPLNGTAHRPRLVAAATAVLLLIGIFAASPTVARAATAPSKLAYPQTTIDATAGTAIAPDKPTVSGEVAAWSIIPDLPSGLAIGNSTGSIYGTPAAASLKTTYTVTAKNTAGSTTARLEITVAVAPPSQLKYPRKTINATIGKAISPDTPTVSGKVSSWSIYPSLVAGLKFSTANGEISGTPAAWDCATTYVVTAKNSSGSAKADVNICVTGAHRTLLELGHGSGISGLKFVDGRVFSADSSGHWVIWNYASGGIIADGDGIPGPTYVYGQLFKSQIAAAGGIAVIPLANGLEIRTMSTGVLVAKIDVPGLNLGPTPSGQLAPWWQLASDGSYIVIGSSASLDFYSPAGDKTLSVAGDFSSAQVFAAPGKVSVALGPKGANVIETISATTAKSTLSPKFNGYFSSWFADGSHFTSLQSNTCWIYSSAAVQQTIAIVTAYQSVSGEGDWYWIYSSTGPVGVYRIGSGTPAFSYNDTINAVIVSGTTLAILPYTEAQIDAAQAKVNLVDLSGKTPVVSQYSPPISALGNFAIDSSGDWVLGNGNGVLLDGSSLSETPRYFGYGKAWSIAGAASTIATASNRVAIATAIGKIFLYNPNPAAPVYKGFLSFPAGVMEMSANGSILGAAENFDDSSAYGTLNFYSLPSGEVLSSFDYNPYTPPYTDGLGGFTLSASGKVIGQIAADEETVTQLSGSPVIWSASTDGAYLYQVPPILLSPDGTLIAQSDFEAGNDDMTYIWKNGVLSSAITGQGIGWIDNNRILAAEFEMNPEGGLTYTGSAIYSADGNLLASLPDLPQLTAFQPVGSNSIYSPATNGIYSLTTGEAVWAGALPPAGVGSISGHQVVYESGHTVVVETY